MTFHLMCFNYNMASKTYHINVYIEKNSLQFPHLYDHFSDLYKEIKGIKFDSKKANKKVFWSLDNYDPDMLKTELKHNFYRSFDTILLAI